RAQGAREEGERDEAGGRRARRRDALSDRVRARRSQGAEGRARRGPGPEAAVARGCTRVCRAEPERPQRELPDLRSEAAVVRRAARVRRSARRREAVGEIAVTRALREYIDQLGAGQPSARSQLRMPTARIRRSARRREAVGEIAVAHARALREP